MRYAEIENGKVRFVLPAEIAGAYLTMPPNAVEIALDADVAEGDGYEVRTVTEKGAMDLKGELAPDTVRVESVFIKPVMEDQSAKEKQAFDAERSRRFEDTRWVRERHADRADMGIDDKANWGNWLAYWQAMRDMPDTVGFNPAAPVWPEKPE